MQTTYQAGVIRIIPNRNQIDLEALGFENHVGTRDRKLPDAAFAKAAADDDALGIGPSLGFHKSLGHISEFLGEFLDRAMHQRRGMHALARQRLSALALVPRLRDLAAPRIFAGFFPR